MDVYSASILRGRWYAARRLIFKYRSNIQITDYIRDVLYIQYMNLIGMCFKTVDDFFNDKAGSGDDIDDTVLGYTDICTETD